MKANCFCGAEMYRLKKSALARKDQGPLPAFHLCKLLLQALNFVLLQWGVKVRSSVNVKIY